MLSEDERAGCKKRWKIGEILLVFDRYIVGFGTAARRGGSQLPAQRLRRGSVERVGRHC